MSPVFRHGKLRLYLLKLLDEAPRHGYEVIRLLRDRFLGVYAPSPGTIYPRLTRLEEEGLVTHEEVGGRKVYRITDKGRAELRARLDDLAELESELTASVRDIARDITEDVRETVRTLRERANRGWGEWAGWGDWSDWSQWGGGWDSSGGGEPHAQDAGKTPASEHADRGGTEHAGQSRPGSRHTEQTGAGTSHAGQTGPGSPWPPGCADPRTYHDLERLARQFSQDLQAAALQAQAVSQDAVRELRGILSEALDRIRTDVFCGTSTTEPPGSRGPGAEPGPSQDEPGADTGA
jgi:DNA-binding PadR family transcriptional regulator